MRRRASSGVEDIRPCPPSWPCLSPRPLSLSLSLSLRKLAAAAAAAGGFGSPSDQQRSMQSDTARLMIGNESVPTIIINNSKNCF